MAPVAAVSHHIGAWRLKRHVSAVVRDAGQVVGAPIAERNHLSPLTRLRSQRRVVECRPCLRVADTANRQVSIVPRWCCRFFGAIRLSQPMALCTI